MYCACLLPCERRGTAVGPTAFRMQQQSREDFLVACLTLTLSMDSVNTRTITDATCLRLTHGFSNAVLQCAG